MLHVEAHRSTHPGCIACRSRIHLLARDGTLADLGDTGEAYDVRILRDEWGVPHVFGQTDRDVAYGLAYAHAEDDFLTIQQTTLAARGRLATVYGIDAAPNDHMVHLLRIWDVAEASYASGLSPEIRAICEAYADGLNHYADQALLFASQQLKPVWLDAAEIRALLEEYRPGHELAQAP